MRVDLRFPEPVTLVAGDREFTLRATLGAIRRTKTLHGVDAAQLDGTNILPFLFECVVNRPADLTLEEFSDMIPLDPEGLERLVAALLPQGEARAAVQK